MGAKAIIEQLEHPAGKNAQLQLSFDELNSTTSTAPRAAGLDKWITAASAVPEVPVAPSVTGRHQDVRLYVTVLLKTFVEMTDAGIVRDAPFQVHLDKDTHCAPDVVFVMNTDFDRVHETYLDGAPDIVVEVTTPESTAVDRGDKFVLYEQHEVTEYWLIDPDRELANIFHLGPDKVYDDMRPDTTGRLRSRVLKGFILDTGKLWNRVLPTTKETLELVQSMTSPA